MESHDVDARIAELLVRYEDDVSMTFGDLVEGVEDLLKENIDEDLSRIVGKYREEERYDRECLGMRGDMESVEQAFLAALHIRVGEVSIDNQEAIFSGSWDYTLVNEAIENKRPYPAALIEKIIGARTYELPLLERAGYILQGDFYVPPTESD
jgi:hypothetical protein